MKEVGYPECNKVGQTYGWVLNLFGVKTPIIPKVRVEKVSYLFTRSARYTLNTSTLLEGILRILFLCLKISKQRCLWYRV